MAPVQHQRRNDDRRTGRDHQRQFFGVRVVADVRARLGVERQVRSRQNAKRGPRRGQFVQVIQHPQQPGTTPLVTKQVRAMRLPIGVQRDPGRPGESPLEEPPSEDNLRPQQRMQELHHRGKANQFGDAPREPLGLHGRAGLCRTVAGVPHLGRPQFRLNAVDLRPAENPRQDHVTFDFEEPHQFRHRHRPKVGLVDVHEADRIGRHESAHLDT